MNTLLNLPHTPPPPLGHCTQNDAVTLTCETGREPTELFEQKILDSADAFYASHGDWPRWDSGPLTELPRETWYTVSEALVLGLRGFAPGGSLSGFLARRERARYNALDENLSVGQIMAWAKAWRKRTSSWPTTFSGEVPGQGGLTWRSIDRLLRSGRAGRPAGTSLSLLRIDEYQDSEQTPLTQQQILGWSDAHRNRTGRWPVCTSGRILDAPGETWLKVSLALMRGSRGLDERSSLSELLRKHRGVRRSADSPLLSIPQIIAWADAHHSRTGKWPNQLAGPILEAPDESWQNVQAALYHGNRGLPGGSSLAQLLAAERGTRNRRCPPDLTVQQILAWADAFHSRNGFEPKPTSGPIPEAPGETWRTVEAALKAGARGVAGTSGLTELLAEHRGWRNPARRPPLTVPQLRAWAEAYRFRTGRWPNARSGRILEAPRETWFAVHCALRDGSRGLPGGSSLARLKRARLAKAGSTE
jgi:hypothetical protein